MLTVAKYSRFPKCTRDTKVFKSAKNDSYNSYHVLKSTGLKRGLYLKNSNTPTPSPSMCGGGGGRQELLLPTLAHPKKPVPGTESSHSRAGNWTQEGKGGNGEVFPLK